MSPPGSDVQLRVVLQVWSKSSQVREEAWRTVCRPSENSRICTKHSLAIERLAPKENVFLGSPKLFTAQAWARWRHSNQGTVIRLRTAQAQPTDLNDKKHLLLRSGEVRRGARVERNSAPRLLLKTACSGATRTKEYERALSLPGKGQHPKSAVLQGRPTPISDEDWDKWHESHSKLFFCLRELSCS